MEFVLTCPEKPLLLNQERKQHWTKRAEHTRLWRQYGMVLAKQAGIGKHDQIKVSVQHNYKGRTPDVVACFPSAKAFIDGLVDALVIPDDDPEHLISVEFYAPRRTGEHEVVFIVEVIDEKRRANTAEQAAAAEDPHETRREAA